MAGAAEVARDAQWEPIPGIRAWRRRSGPKRSQHDLLRGSHSVPSLSGGIRSVAAADEGTGMTENLSVVVGVDLDCALMRIEARGMVTSTNVRALYALIRRATSTLPGVGVVMDLTAAVIEPSALEQLRGCERAHRLPVEMDPAQQDVQLTVLPEPGRGPNRAAHRLAA